MFDYAYSPVTFKIWVVRCKALDYTIKFKMNNIITESKPQIARAFGKYYKEVPVYQIQHIMKICSRFWRNT